MVATTLPPPPLPGAGILPPPPPPDPSLVTPPPTTIYAGGQIPGSQMPPVPGGPPPAVPLSTVGPGVTPPGTLPATKTAAMNKLSQLFKSKMGRDATDADIQALLRGESVSLSRPQTGAAVGQPPPVTNFAPRGWITPRGQQERAAVALTKAQTAEITGRTGIAQSTEKRAERESREKATGYTGGEPLTAEDLNLDLAGIYGGDGKINKGQWNKVSEVAAPLLTAMGYDLNTEAGKKALDDLLRGQTIVPPRMRTIEAQKTISEITNDTRRVNLADREVTVGEKRQEWDQIAEQAKLTGKLHYNGVTTDTVDRWNLQIQQAALYGRAGEIKEGDPTLQARMQTWDQMSRDKVVFGFDRTDEKGNLLLGADGKPIHVYGTNELPWVMQTRDQEWAKAQLTGFDYVDSATGESRHVMGRDEQITSQQQFEERTRTGYDRFAYEIDPNTGKPRINPRTGAPLILRDSAGHPILEHIEGTQEVSDRLTTRELDLREQGMNKDDAARAAALEWDRQQYEGYHRVRTINLKSLGLSVPTAALASGTLLAEWLGVNTEAAGRLAAALGHPPTAEELAGLAKGGNVALSKATTRTINTATGPRTETVYEPIVDYIEGTADLETARTNMQLTLEQEGNSATAARQTADQVYQDKVRNGYWTTSPTGQPVWVRGQYDQETYVAYYMNTMQVSRDEAQRAWQTSERGGTQEHDLEVLRIQQRYGMDQAAAERKWQEEQRVGYERNVPMPDGTYRTIRVAGTEEFQASQLQKELTSRESIATAANNLTIKGWRRTDANQAAEFQFRINEQKIQLDFTKGQADLERQLIAKGWRRTDANQAAEFTFRLQLQDREDALVADGWDREDARARVAWQRNEQIRTGYFTPSGEWVPGSQEHENELARLAREHDVDLQDARIASAASESKLGRLHDKWLQNRAQQYQREGYNRADALAGANREWQTNDNALERTLSRDLKNLELTASENKLEAEGRMQFLTASITALSTLGAAGLKLLFDSSGKVSQFVSGIADGTVTAANLKTAAMKYGLSEAEANTLYATAAAGGSTYGFTAGSGVMVDSISVGEGLSAAPEVPIGAQLLNAAVPLAAVAVMAYAGWDTYAEYRRGHKAEKTFDEWFGEEGTIGGLPPAERAAFRAIVEETSIDWNDHRQDALKELNEFMATLDPNSQDNPAEAPATGNGRGKRFYLKLQDLASKDTVRVAAAIRAAADEGALTDSFQMSHLSRGTRTRLLDAWDRLPAAARTVTENASFEEKFKDLQLYGAATKVRTSAQLVADIKDVTKTLGPKIAKIFDTQSQKSQTFPDGRVETYNTYNADILTLGEEQTIRQLWAQRGGDPRVDLGYQAIHLNEDPDSVLGWSHEWIAHHVTPYMDAYK